MIIICSTLISVVAAYLVYAALSPVVTVTASTEVATVRVGDPISVNVSVKNVSRRELALVYHVKLSEGTVVPMAFAMRDEAGNLASETNLGQEANGHTTIRGYSSMVAVRLRSNSALSGPEKVSDLYEIRRPGKYTIEALVPVITKQLSAPTNEHDFREVKVFHSNIVTIIVTAATAEKVPSPTANADAVSTPVHAVLPAAARSARILDASGTESTVRDVGCDLGGAVYIWWGVNLEGRQQVKPFIVLVSKGLQLAIPIAAVTKLETNGRGVTVTYTTRNGEKTFTGQPYFYSSGRDQDEEAVVGKSDFGPLKLSLRKIKRLEFSEPGKATGLDHTRYPGRDLSPSPATITLTDGTTIKAGWFVRAWSDEGSTFADDFFSLSRGESLLNVPFKDLTKVEFLKNNMVSVTMADGARADMKLASKDWALNRTFAGLMGAGEAEYFRVDRSILKTIEFENKRK